MKNKTVKLLAAMLAAASLSSAPAMAADSNDYILLLPKTDGISYEMDQDHVADQYSNDQYTVLLYKEGDTVEVTVNGADGYEIKDAMGSDDTDYAAEEADGKVSFTMPAEDLSLSVFDVAEKTEGETESQTSGETEAETETQTEASESPTEASTSGNIMIVAAKASLKDSSDSLSQGERVKVLDEKDGWSQIQFVKDGNIQEGSVKTSDLTSLSSLYVTTANVNVRAEASDASEKLGKVESGKEVIVSDTSQGKWDKVMFVSDNTIREAYMFAQYLQPVENPSVDELLTK